MHKHCNPQPKVFLTEVKEVGVNQGGYPVEYDTPFYDTTLPNRHVVIPAVDGNFILEVPLSTRWFTGQWVQLENIGRYPIVNVLNQHQLVLHNTAGVPGNPDVGAQFIGSRKVWPISRVIADQDENVTGVEAALVHEDFDFNVMTAAANAAENGTPIAALLTGSACQPCNAADNNSNRLVRALRAFVNIIFKYRTIALPQIPQTSEGKITFIRNGAEVTEPMRDVVVNPQTGDLLAKTITLSPAVDYYYQGAKQSLPVPSDYAQRYYILAPHPLTGAPTWRNFNFDAAHYLGGIAQGAGSLNIKTAVEGALNITLPSTGEIQVGIAGKHDNTSSSTAAGTVISAAGYRVLSINLASPTVTFVSGNFFLEVAYIPFNYYHT